MRIGRRALSTAWTVCKTLGRAVLLVAHWLRRWVPVLYAVSCVLAFSITAYLYFVAQSDKKHQSPLAFNEWLCFGAKDTTKPIIRMALDKIEQDEAKISTLAMSLPSSDKADGKKHGTAWELFMWSRAGETGTQSHQQFVLRRSTDIEGRDEIQTAPTSAMLAVGNTRQLFPYDQYVFEIGINLVDVSTENRVPSSLMLKSNLDSSYVARTFDNFGDFMRLRGERPVRTEGRKTLPNECIFVLERALWLKSGVWALILLLFAPVLFALYKEDESPGLELITTVVYVGLIRTYLLDSRHGMDFYVIDLVFGLVILLVAVIPAVRLSMNRLTTPA